MKTRDRITFDDRYKEIASNSDARLIPFTSVSTAPHIRSDRVDTREDLSAVYLEQHYVPRQGKVPRPRLLRFGSHGPNRGRWEISDPYLDFADHGSAMDRGAGV